MLALNQSQCTVCHPDSPKITPREWASYQNQLPDWKQVTHNGLEQITKTFAFKDFKSALAFSNQVGSSPKVKITIRIF